MTTAADIDSPFHTTLLMSTSATFMGGLGVGASLFPETILTGLDVESEHALLLLLKVVGALYLGFAGLNWMARHHLIGGIYSRPVAIGNFLHFFAAAIVMVEQLLTQSVGSAFVAVAAAYIVFAGSFGYVVSAKGQQCG